jgi:hypothetical protein
MNEKRLPCPWCQKIPSLWTPREVRGMNANCICFTLRVRPEIWNTRAVDGEKEKMATELAAQKALVEQRDAEIKSLLALSKSDPEKEKMRNALEKGKS